MNKIVIIIAAAAALIFASTTSHAERFSLDCTLTGNQSVLTFVVDTSKSTADDLPATIDDKKIAWDDGQWQYLIDRPTGVLTASKMGSNLGASRATCIKSVDHKPKSNPMGELANRSGDEFLATTRQCDQYPVNSQGRKICLNRVAHKWLRERGKEFEHYPAGYITGNDLARTFIEKTK